MEFVEGARFSSYSEFERQYGDWKKQNCHLMRKYTSRSFKNKDVTNEIKQTFKYSKIMFVCGQQRYPAADCPVQLRLVFKLGNGIEEDALVIKKLITKHENHKETVEKSNKSPGRTAPGTPLDVQSPLDVPGTSTGRGMLAGSSVTQKKRRAPWTVTKVISGQPQRKELTDKYIAEGCRLLRYQFPTIHVGQVSKPGALKKPLKGYPIQVLRDPQRNHWILIQIYEARNPYAKNRNCCNEDVYDGEKYYYHVEYYDSLFDDVSNEVILQIADILQSKEKDLRIEIMPTQKQDENVASGLFVMAWACEMCYGRKPCDIRLFQPELRKHYSRCLQTKKITRFPRTNLMPSTYNSMKEKIVYKMYSLRPVRNRQRKTPLESPISGEDIYEGLELLKEEYGLMEMEHLFKNFKFGFGKVWFQLLHDSKRNNWSLISNCKPNDSLYGEIDDADVYYYDSVFDSISDDVILQIAQNLQLDEDQLEIAIMPTQKQDGSVDSGLFVMAWAIALCYDWKSDAEMCNPCDMHILQNGMPKHYFSCLDTKRMTLFPYQLLTGWFEKIVYQTIPLCLECHLPFRDCVTRCKTGTWCSEETIDDDNNQNLPVSHSLVEKYSNILNGQKLTVEEIAEGCRLLKEKFPNINGLQSPLEWKELTLNANLKGLQVLHDSTTDRWVLIDTKHTWGKDVAYYTSNYDGDINECIIFKITHILKCKKDKLKITIKPEQKQEGDVDSGLFVMAWAMLLCYDDFCGMHIVQDQMREHYFRCLESKRMTLFPYRITEEIASIDKTIPLCLQCHLPAQHCSTSGKNCALYSEKNICEMPTTSAANSSSKL